LIQKILENKFHIHVIKARALETEAKAKAWTLTAKAMVKDMIFFPPGFSRPRAVLEDYIAGNSSRRVSNIYVCIMIIGFQSK
jgi:hypothetical protein